MAIAVLSHYLDDFYTVDHFCVTVIEGMGESSSLLLRCERTEEWPMSDDVSDNAKVYRCYNK